MEPFSSFFISIVAGLATNTIEERIDSGVLKELKGAYEQALRIYSPNKEIRKEDDKRLRKVLEQLVDDPSMEIEQLLIDRPQIEIFLSEFKMAVADRQAAYNFFKDARDKRRNEDALDAFDRGKNEIVYRLDRIEESLMHSKLLFEREPKIDRYTSSLGLIDTYIKRDVLLSHADSSSTEAESSSLTSVIQDFKKVLLLGQPGLGKSEELNALAVELGKEKMLFPVFRSLKSYKGEQIQDYIGDGWFRANSEASTVLILDGLEEIGAENQAIFIDHVTTFFQWYPDVSMIISCRSNFYTTSFNLPGFKTCSLAAFNTRDISNYIRKVKPNIDAKDFIDQVQMMGISSLAEIPFYLKYLVQIYAETGQLPQKRSVLIQAIFNARFELDFKHFVTDRDFRKNEAKIKLALEKVAFAMQCQGTAILSESELNSLLKNEEVELVKKGTVFISTSEGWVFEHKTLQEYMCASGMSKVHFDDLKQVVTYEGSENLLNPLWSNVLVLLVSILDQKSTLYSSLLQWLGKHARQIIVKSETDHLDTCDREGLFKEIFDFYKEKNIWIDRRYFSIQQLASFSDNFATLDFLLEESKSKHKPFAQRQAIELIGHMRVYLQDEETEQTVRNHLTALATSNTENRSFSVTCMNAIADSTLATTEIVLELLRAFSEAIDQDVRKVLYDLIAATNSSDHCLNYITSGLNLIWEEKGDRRNYLTGESTSLNSAISGINNEKSIVSLIFFISDLITSSSHAMTLAADRRELVIAILKTCKHHFSTSSKARSGLSALFIDLDFFKYEEELLYLADFFLEVSYSETLSHKMLQMEDRSHGFEDKLAMISSPDIVKKFVQSVSPHAVNFYTVQNYYYAIKRYNIDLESVCLNWIHLYLPLTIPLIQPTIVKKTDQARVAVQNGFNLLFSPTNLIFYCRHICKFLGGDEISWRELNKLDRHYEAVEITVNSGARRFLDELCREEDHISDEFLHSLSENHKKIDRIRFWLVGEFLGENDFLKVTAGQKKILQVYCEELMQNFSFRTAIEFKGDGTLSVKGNSFLVDKLRKHCELQFEDDILLDMLEYGFPRLERDLIKERYQHIYKSVSEEKVYERMSANLTSGRKMIISAFHEHLNYCSERGLDGINEILLSSLSSNHWSTNEIVEIAEKYIKYGFNVDQIFEFALSQQESVKWRILDSITGEYENELVIPLTFRLFQECGNEKEKFKSAQLLVRLNVLEGLQWIGNWIKEDSPKRLHDDVINFRRFTNFYDHRGVPVLAELLVLCYTNSVSNQSKNLVESGIRSMLITIGSSSVDGLSNLSVAIEDIIASYQDDYESIPFLFHIVDEARLSFYSSQAKTIGLEKSKVLFEKMRV